VNGLAALGVVLAGMSAAAHVLVIVLAAAVIAFIVALVRSRRLRAKYSVLWFSIGIGLAILAIFPGLLSWVSDRFGIAYPPATFMLLALSFLLVLVLHFSWELSRLEDRTRALAEEYALLRLELDERLRTQEAAHQGTAGHEPTPGNAAVEDGDRA
jgi:hypothetical protein